MKRKNMTLVLGLALICGGLAAYLSFTYLRSSGASGVAVASEPASSRVIVASRDMQIGRVITPADIKQVDWPSGNMPLGYSSSPSEVVGRGLLTPVRANEPLLTNKLALKEAGGGLTITIPEGKRAMSVKVDEVIGVAGFVLPGTRVDVLVTVDQLAKYEEPTTKLILQNITVLAAGQTVQENEQGEPQTVTVVTLVVTPDEGEKLALSASKGRIQLALRNGLDLDTVETQGIRSRSLIATQR
ncbi:MAG: Flp pilus assembly protein CpaB, partial [Gemmatimonadales bacterium]